jgi:hypothetical protein
MTSPVFPLSTSVSSVILLCGRLSIIPGCQPHLAAIAMCEVAKDVKETQIFQAITELQKI